MSLTSTPPRRRRLAGAAVVSMLVTACGADQGVSTTGVNEITVESGSITAPTSADTTPTTPNPTPESTTESPSDTTSPGTTTPQTTPQTTLPPITEPELAIEIPIADVVDVGDDKPQRDYDTFLAVAFTDIESWWTETYPAVYGSDIELLEGKLYAGYPGRSPDVPGCGEPITRYEDLNLYAAFYCELGDFMAYDDGDDSILTQLAVEIGPAVMGVVLAHEYGHLIQQRIGALDRGYPTVITEQQADCFAGAWAGQAYRGESDLLRLGDTDLRAGLLAMLEVRDPVGTDQFSPGGHGSAFDRVGAFQEGFTSGAARCAELLDEPLDLMPNEFWNYADLDRGGNASYDCSDDPSSSCVPAYEFLAADLNDFWTTNGGTDVPVLTPVPVDDLSTVTCDGMVVLAPEAAYCPDDATVVYDEPEVLELYDEFGDFTLGYFYGIAWAEAAQQSFDSPLSGERRALLNDCLTGAWVRDITPEITDPDLRPDSDVAISPGDLDEAIRMAILIGDRGANVDQIGSPFEKIGSFRTGVLGGLATCEADFLN